MASLAETKRSASYSLYILLLLLVINALSYADRHVFSVLIPAIKGEFATSDSVLGLIGGPGFILSYVLFSVPLARLADRKSRRAVLASSVMLWSAATAACGAAGNMVQLALARLTVGIGEAGRAYKLNKGVVAKDKITGHPGQRLVCNVLIRARVPGKGELVASENAYCKVRRYSGRSCIATSGCYKGNRLGQSRFVIYIVDGADLIRVRGIT